MGKSFVFKSMSRMMDCDELRGEDGPLSNILPFITKENWMNAGLFLEKCNLFFHFALGPDMNVVYRVFRKNCVFYNTLQPIPRLALQSLLLAGHFLYNQ